MNKILTLMTIATLAIAQTFYVSTTPELRTALETAATNGENDTINLADGTYKTTDDGHGTFIYFSNESNDLTLLGSSAGNVILSGDNLHQIFNHKSTINAPLKLEKLSFVDGNNTATTNPEYNGGGVYTNYNIIVTDCNFTNNSAVSGGGGFYSDKGSNTVTDSIFINNTSGAAGGGFNSGGFDGSLNDSTNVINCIFTNNSAVSSGGGYKAKGVSEVLNSIFTNNNSQHQGGGFTSYSAKVTNSQFINNTAEDKGGGFSAYSGYAEVIDSMFTNNNCASVGGGFNSFTNSIVTNSVFTNNSSGSSGGGFHSSYSTINNSIFTYNTAGKNGGGFVSSTDTRINNSILANNTAEGVGGGFYSSWSTTNDGLLEASNLLIISNSSGIYLQSGEKNVIYNSVFINNNNLDIEKAPAAIATLNNNYIDESNLEVTNFKYNNIFSGIALGFLDEVNENYNLSALSDLIDAGTNPGLYGFPSSDVNGYSRVVGSGIDIGPYEYQFITIPLNLIATDGTALAVNLTWTLVTGVSSYKIYRSESSDVIGTIIKTVSTNSFVDDTVKNDTKYYYRVNGCTGAGCSSFSNVDSGYIGTLTKPKINLLTYTGTAAEYNQLIFNIDYALSIGRTIAELSYDYLNNDSYTALNTHTFNTPGTYTINAKVTDNAGEFSITSLDITIEPLAFENMTAEQKFLEAIDPIYYDDIVAIIASEKENSKTSGITVGENNVVLSPNTYALVTQTDSDTAVAMATTTATAAGIITGDAAGRTYVQTNPAEFALVTQTDSDTAVAMATAAGREMVLSSPSAYGLIVATDANSSVTEALAAGTASGKQYVQDNTAEFGLVTKSDIDLTSANISALSTGWTLVSTPFAITDLSVFDSASIVWIYNNSTAAWSAYSSNATTRQAITDSASVTLLTTIPAGSGVWVQK